MFSHVADVETYYDKVDTVLVEGYEGDVKIVWHIPILLRRRLERGDFLVDGISVTANNVYMWNDEKDCSPVPVIEKYCKQLMAVNEELSELDSSIKKEVPSREREVKEWDDPISEHLKSPLLGIEMFDKGFLFANIVSVNPDGVELGDSVQIPVEEKVDYIYTFILHVYSKGCHIVEREEKYIGYDKSSKHPIGYISFTEEPLLFTTLL